MNTLVRRFSSLGSRGSVARHAFQLRRPFSTGSGSPPPPNFPTGKGGSSPGAIKIAKDLIFALFAGSATALALAHMDGTPDFLQSFHEQKRLLVSTKKSGVWDAGKEKFVEELARYSDSNDSAKELAAADGALCKELFTLALSSEGLSNPRFRALAMRCLERICRDDLGALAEAARGRAEQLVAVLADPAVPIEVTDAAAAVLSNMALVQDMYPRLMRAGVVPALHHYMETRAETGKGNIRRAILAASAGLHDSTDPALVAYAADPVIANYASEAIAARDDPLKSLTNPLLDLGLSMYLNTMAGGALWGLAVGLYEKSSPRIIGKNMFRTAIITGVVPVYFMGIAVTAFNSQRRKVDTRTDFFGLYTLGLLSLYPWVHLLPVVEAWAPLWLGGHVVGFMTFGGYLIATKADIMQRKVKPAA